MSLEVYVEDLHDQISRLMDENSRLRTVNDDLLLGGEIVDKMCEEIMDERDQLKAENESLRKDSERFAYIERDADSGMSKIYGDDWVAVIDAALGQGEKP